jgi:hypothetical protein
MSLHWNGAQPDGGRLRLKDLPGEKSVSPIGTVRCDTAIFNRQDLAQARSSGVAGWRPADRIKIEDAPKGAGGSVTFQKINNYGKLSIQS